jgi:hypothetical protein
MQFQVRLVHAEPGSRVVAVSALQAGQLQATALGEGRTAEEAEDRAWQRLQNRLSPPATAAPEAPIGERRLPGPLRSEPASSQPTHSEPARPAPVLEAAAEPPPPLPQPLPQPPEEPTADPDDWSAELARIDLQLQRLGWQRAEESAYLERAFGHPSRGRITTYADLLAYLQALEGFEAGSDPACVPVPLRRRDLLLQSDALLRQLGWDAAQGRARLEQEFACSSRQQLSDAQLLHFNMLLEEALLASGQCGGAPEAG